MFFKPYLEEKDACSLSAWGHLIFLFAIVIQSFDKVPRDKLSS